MNGQAVTEFVLTENRFKAYEVVIPRSMIGDNRLELTFVLPDAASPASLGTGEDTRELGLAFLKLQIDPVDS